MINYELKLFQNEKMLSLISVLNYYFLNKIFLIRIMTKFAESMLVIALFSKT